MERGPAPRGSRVVVVHPETDRLRRLVAILRGRTAKRPRCAARVRRRREVPGIPAGLVVAESGEPRIPEATLRLDREGVASSISSSATLPEWPKRLRREGAGILVVHPETDRIRRLVESLRRRALKHPPAP